MSASIVSSSSDSTDRAIDEYQDSSSFSGSTIVVMRVAKGVLRTRNISPASLEFL